MTVFKKYKNVPRRKKNEIMTAYFFLAPIIILMGIWFYYPVVSALTYSFTDMNFLKPHEMVFTGLSNYRGLLKDRLFIKAIRNTMVLTLLIVPIQSMLALILASALNGVKKLKGFFRTVFYLPYITSTVAVTTVLMYLFQKNGIAVNVLRRLGFRNVSWFADVDYALPFLAIIIIWTFVGFYIIIYLASMQSIPKDMYHAADVDGANVFQKFFFITIPVLRPTHYLVFTSGFIFAMQIFDQPFIMARSAPLGTPAGATSTAILFFYNEAFVNSNGGYASAAAFLVFIIILVVSVLQRKFFEGDEV